VTPMPELGPIEIIVIDFEGYHFKGEILPELERLKENDIVRLVDLLVVRKDRSGALAVTTASDLGMQEMLEFGAKIGGLIASGISDDAGVLGALAGLDAVSSGHIFDEREAQRLAAQIPPGFAAAVAIVEHRWAIPLREAIARADGVILSEEWVTPNRLVELGESSKLAAQARPTNGHGAE